LRDDVQEVLV